MKAIHLLSSLGTILIMHFTVSAQFFNDVQVGYHISGGVSGLNYSVEPFLTDIGNGFSYNGGVEFSKPIGRFSLTSGLTYSVFKSQYAYRNLTFGDMIDPRKGFIFATNDAPPSDLIFYESFHFLQVPIGIHGIQRISKKSFISYGTGLTLSYMIREAERQNYAILRNQDSDPTKWNKVPDNQAREANMALSVQGSLLYTRAIKGQTIKVGPVFEHFLTSPWKTHEDLKIRPYRLALQLVFAPNFSKQ